MKLLFTWPSGFRSAISSGLGKRPGRGCRSYIGNCCDRASRRCAGLRKIHLPCRIQTARRCGMGLSGAPVSSNASPMPPRRCRAQSESRRAADREAFVRIRLDPLTYRLRTARVELQAVCCTEFRWTRRSAGRSGTRRRKSRNRPRKRKRLSQRIAREIVNELRMPETHFDFRGMNVHVHFLVRQIEEKQHARENARRHDVAIRLADGVQQQPVAHQAPVHKNIDAVAICALHFRAAR